jgi:hypothetical protein
MDMHRLGGAIAGGGRVAVLWGLLSAAITRALMRAVTLITEGTPEFTWVGTLGIGLIYIAALLPGAVALAYSAGRWPWILFGGGIAALAYGAIVIGVGETAHAEDLSVWRWGGLILLLLAMVAMYSAQVALVYRGARPREHAHV